MQTNSPHKSTALQLCRYAIVGVASNAVAYLLYLLLTHFGLMPKAAMTFVYTVSATVGYFGNRQLTFSFTGDVFGSGIRYLMAHAAGYLLNLIILTVFVDNLGYPHQLVQAIAILVVALFLFISFKFFVFKPSS